jgi:hypothetical protein
MREEDALKILRRKQHTLQITDKEFWQALKVAEKSLYNDVTGWTRGGIHPDEGASIIAEIEYDIVTNAGTRTSTYYDLLYWYRADGIGVIEDGYYKLDSEGWIEGPFRVKKWRYLF